jgi:hypothetical protein
MGQIDLDGSNSTLKADVIRGQASTTVKLGGLLDTDGNYIQTEKGGDLTSASPLVIDTDGDYFDVTGTTNFAAMTVAADRQFTLQFDGALTMTHHATNLDLPGEANITTAAGDVATFQSTGSNTVQCINYTRADGSGIAGGGDFADGGEAGGAARTLGNTDAYDFGIETNNVNQFAIKGDSVAGVWSTPNQSAVGCYKDTNDVATATLTKSIQDGEFYDIHSEHDAVHPFRFTATVAGKYLVLFQASMTLEDLGDGKSLRTLVYKNGSDYETMVTRNSMASAVGAPCSSACIVVDMAASDYLESWYIHDHGSNRSINSFTSIVKIS